MVQFHYECLRLVLCGGNANNGANAGSRNVNANNAPGNANSNVGSRLNMAYTIIRCEVDPCLLAKHNQLQPPLVAVCERGVLAKPKHLS